MAKPQERLRLREILTSPASYGQQRCHLSLPEVSFSPCRFSSAIFSFITTNSISFVFLYNPLSINLIQSYDANVLKGDQVIGRAFVGPLEAEEMIQTENPKLIPIGYNIGVLKIQIYKVSKRKYHVCEF